MKLVLSVFVAAFLGSLQVLLAEVTVLRAVQVIYDESPKLRIKGSTFDVQDHLINLEMGASGQPLIVDQHYMVTKDSDGDGLILKLLGNNKWVDLSSRTPPVGIVLTAVKFASAPDKNLLPEPVIVAQVLSAPSVNGNDDILFQTASNELRINGTGFIGAKKVDLYFQPPLVKEVAYRDVTPYPLTKNQVVLRLRHGYRWRETPGALFVIGVDTGAGPVRMGGDMGAKVAEVVDNHALASVTVEPTVNEQLVYADQPEITITGTGFNLYGNRNLFSFANGLLGNDINYTTISTTDNKVKLRLTPGSHWRKNMENLPGALTLMTVNIGTGVVDVGSVNSAEGRDVAMIFERPEVHSDLKKIYRTLSHEFRVIGQGFPHQHSGYKVQLKFQPALVENVDYTMRVVDRTELELTLLDGRAWRPDAGGLMVTHINTRGDDAGWVDLPGAGVHVAEVVEDIYSERCAACVQ